MVFFLLNSIAFCISLLGFTGIRIVSYVFGFIAFDILRIRRKIVLANLDIVYGHTLSKGQKINIGRKSFVNFISTAFEFIGAKRLLPKAKFTFINKSYADNFAGKMGGYVICMHFGNWEYLCHINAKIYGPVNVVVKDVLSGSIEKWIKNLRRYLGYQLIGRKDKLTATQQIFNAIDNKQIVGFITDQKRPRGQMLPFFGKTASTNDSLAKLYFKKPAIIVSAIIKRIKPGHFSVEYLQEFVYKKDATLSLSENITKFTLQVNQFLEPLILSKPDEYYWLHNRWNLKK